jgi:hypothetical protein
MDEATPRRTVDASLLGAKVRVPQHVVYRAFMKETVVLNLETGKYHGLNPIGGRMLDVLERAPTVRQAAAQLAQEFGRPSDEIEQDMRDFCSDLLQRGLIELEDS